MPGRPPFHFNKIENVMCGRFSLSSDPKALADQFSLRLDGLPPLAPRYNIAPTQPVVAVKARNVQGERELVVLQWGLVPSWAKDPAMGSRMINARAETVSEKPSFRTAFKRRRCLLPADGFYEWAKTENGKQPYHIRRGDGAPFAMAGVWEQWQGADGSEIISCAILTTAANSRMKAIHHRMPVILFPHEYSLWLELEERKSPERLSMLASREWEGMEAVPVSSFVNNARNEGSGCIAPAGLPDSAV